LGSYSVDLEMPAKEAFTEIQHCIGTANYNVKSIVPNQSIIAEGGKSFSWAIMILLILFLLVGALIYFLACQRNSITATISETKTGCSLALTSNGKGGDSVLVLIRDVFQKEAKN